MLKIGVFKMPGIKVYLSVLLICFILVACSEKINAQVYVKSGVSIKTPEKWKLGDDKNFMGQRTLSFLTGEFSYVNLVIFSKSETSNQKYKNIKLSTYLDRHFIPLISNFNKDSYRMKSKPITRSPFSGVKITVEYYVPGLDDIEIEAYLLTFDKAKIIAIINTEEENLHDVTGEIQNVLNSIQYAGK